MKKIPINAAHNKSNLEGFIFFAERIKELLAHSVDDSFKVSALNTRTRARELERLLHHAHDTTQRATSLMPLLEEFEASVRDDPIIRELNLKNNLLSMLPEIALAFSNEKPKFMTEAADMLRAISIMLSPYFATAKLIIQIKIDTLGEKKLISHLAEIVVIEIQAQGYSREHIRHISKIKLAGKLLGSKLFKPEDALNEFFSAFTGKKKSFTCITRCKGEFDSDAAEFLNIRMVEVPEGFNRIALLDLTENDSSDRRDNEYDRYLIMNKVMANDPFRARERLFANLHFQNATHQFLLHKPNLLHSEFCLVKDDETKNEIRIRKPLNAMLIGQKQDKNSDTAEAKTQLFFAFSKLDEKSQKALFSAMKYHKEALDSLSVENQLVDLWAALEGFVPQPIDSSPRMTSVLDHVLPAQTLIYAEKKFIYVSEGISRAGQAAIEIVNSVDIDGPFIKKTIALILCPEYKKQIDALMKLLDHSPLLRFRMFTLFENFSTMEKAHAELVRHRNRLDWQLRRIYISRNTVMHSATSYGNTKLLVENLHSYLDILINAVIKVGQNAPKSTSINSILRLLGSYEKSYLNGLVKNPEKEKPLSRDNFDSVLFAKSNPLLFTR